MQYCAQRRATTDLPTPPFSPPMKWIVLMRAAYVPAYFGRAAGMFRFDGESAGGGGRQIGLGQADRLRPLGRRHDQLARVQIEEGDREQRLAAEVPVGVEDLLHELADLPDVRLGPAADRDPLAVPELALELHVDLEDGRADAPSHHLVEAVAVARDEVPARLLEDLEVPGVVDVAEGVEVLFADEERVFVHGAEHAGPPAAELSAVHEYPFL